MAMQPWFTDAKLGIFIHWGIYAVDGVQESWSFYDDIVPYDQYMSQFDRFTAARYDPRDWARLFARAGAKYAVLTSRHHDGVALWDTAYGDLNVGRDLIGGYADALREQGLKVGLYYSHSDWSHPDYASTRKPGRPPELEDNRYSEVAAEDEDLQAWERFLAYRDGQIRELTSRYKPDLLWFDGEWDRSEEQWRIPELAALIRSEVPDVVFNARMLSQGDYATPEQGAPVVPPEGPWELCLTINDSWATSTTTTTTSRSISSSATSPRPSAAEATCCSASARGKTARSRPSRRSGWKGSATGSPGTRKRCTAPNGDSRRATTTDRAPSPRTAARST
ncbi:hypothetical protein SVIOM74S_06059 [Streptomyces violarus]